MSIESRLKKLEQQQASAGCELCRPRPIEIVEEWENDLEPAPAKPWAPSEITCSGCGRRYMTEIEVICIRKARARKDYSDNGPSTLPGRTVKTQ